MARGRSAGYDNQREAILARAAELFAQQGYPGTSMNQVAQACGLSKPAVYHYFRDKYALLVEIAEGHVARLQELVQEVEAADLLPEPRLRELIHRFVEEYGSAQHAHRVLTEDVGFLEPADRERVLNKERQVVEGFAQAIQQLRPQLAEGGMSKPLTMLLFGMINWMFTWLRPDGALTYAAMAPVVTDLFFGGIGAVRLPLPAEPPPDPKTSNGD